MAESDEYRLTLDESEPVFQELSRIAEAFTAKGRRLHVIGGIAVLTLARVASRQRGFLTQDFDAVVRPSDCEDRQGAERLAIELAELRQMLGYSDALGTGRLGSCRFKHITNPFLFELICGDLAIGRASEPPRFRILKGRLYAAHNPWLARLDDRWKAVQARCGPRTCTYGIQDAPGMVVLKIRAVADKLKRLGESPVEERGREVLQFVKHAQDLVLLQEIVEDLDQRPALATLMTRHPVFRDVASKVRSELISRYSTQGPDSIRDLVCSSPSFLLDALEV